jgi:hypothetical protein
MAWKYCLAPLSDFQAVARSFIRSGFRTIVPSEKGKVKISLEK